MVAEAAQGVFGSAQAVRDWIEERFGVVYTRDSMYTLLPRLGIRLKVPRPRHAKTDPQAQATWKKGGLGACLAAVGLKAGQGIVWGDEMRWGLWHAVRKVWAPRGVAVSREVPSGRSYLHVAVGPRSDDGAAVVGLAAEQEGRGDGLHPGGLGRGTRH